MTLHAEHIETITIEGMEVTLHFPAKGKEPVLSSIEDILMNADVGL